MVSIIIFSVLYEEQFMNLKLVYELFLVFTHQKPGKWCAYLHNMCIICKKKLGAYSSKVLHIIPQNFAQIPPSLSDTLLMLSLCHYVVICQLLSCAVCCCQPLLSASVLDDLIHHDKKLSAPMSTSPLDHAGLDNLAELQVNCLYFVFCYFTWRIACVGDWPQYLPCMSPCVCLHNNWKTAGRKLM